MSDDFREQIEFLADRAGEERARIAEDAKPVPTKSRLRGFVIGGLIIALLEIALLAYQSYHESQQLSSTVALPNHLLTKDTCEGERYRASRAILKYMREKGGTPPDSLESLIGTYLPRMPTDPITKQPLKYSRQGNVAKIDCPPMPR